MHSLLLPVTSAMMRSFAGFQRRNASTFLKGLGASVGALPMREAARYTKKNMKWTAGDFDHFSTSHANALDGWHIKSSDTIALWMSESAEKHNTMLSAAKLGVKVADLDHTVTTISDIREFLRASGCKAIFFHPVSNDSDYLMLLRKAIPELAEYDDLCGQHFHSKHFPNLKLFVHTGYDVELGALGYRGAFFPNPPQCAVETAQSHINDDTPAYIRVSKVDGSLKVGPTLRHKDLLADTNWEFAKKLVEQKYFEIDG